MLKQKEKKNMFKKSTGKVFVHIKRFIYLFDLLIYVLFGLGFVLKVHFIFVPQDISFSCTLHTTKTLDRSPNPGL